MKRLARRLAERFGWQVLERRFYSPVPVLDELPDDIFERESALSGIALDIGAQLDFAEHSLRPFLTEFGDGPPGFAPDNAFYETGDAEIAYAFVRHLRPRLIVSPPTPSRTASPSGSLP